MSRRHESDDVYGMIEMLRDILYFVWYFFYQEAEI
jgi:hypothetical protein